MDAKERVDIAGKFTNCEPSPCIDDVKICELLICVKYPIFALSWIVLMATARKAPKSAHPFPSPNCNVSTIKLETYP